MLNVIVRATIGTSERAEIILLTAFSCGIDLRPFNPLSASLSWGKKEVDGNLKYCMAVNNVVIGEDGLPLCPSHSAPAIEKSITLLDKLLEKMSTSEATFQFWYTLFRDYYLSISAD